MATDAGVEKKDKPLLLKFWAPWCAPCKAIAPVLESVMEKHGGVKLESVNIDEDPSVAVKYGIRSIPTLVLVRDKGCMCARLTGLRSQEEIDRFLSENM